MNIKVKQADPTPTRGLLYPTCRSPSLFWFLGFCSGNIYAFGGYKGF
jgi:hypothetical protein